LSPTKEARLPNPEQPAAAGQADPFLAEIQAYVATWHGIIVPNDPARRLAADLASTIKAFEAQRARLRFEDEPSSFEAALRDMKEGA
jgi:hypothetical protein